MKNFLIIFNEKNLVNFSDNRLKEELPMLPWKWLTFPGCQGPWATITVVSKLKGKEGGNFKGSLKF